MKTARAWLPLVFLAAASLAAGCDEATGPTGTTTDLTGAWSYSFIAIDSTPCSQPGLVAGISGGGMLELVQVGPKLTGTWTARGGSQTCGGAADFATSGMLQPAWSFTSLDFSLLDCEFHADLPPGPVETVSGTIHCNLSSGQVAHGTWSMTRSPGTHPGGDTR